MYRFAPQVWKRRPLSATLLRYAVQDAALLLVAWSLNSGLQNGFWVGVSSLAWDNILVLLFVKGSRSVCRGVGGSPVHISRCRAGAI